MVNKGIPIEQLDEETREKLGLPQKQTQFVSDNLVVLGKVLKSLKGLTKQDALWIVNQVKGYIEGKPEISEYEVSEDYVPPPGYVINVVAKTLKVKTSEITLRRRKVEVVLARQVVMYVRRMTTKYTLTKIGREIGGRSPATVSHGFQRIADRITKDHELKDKVMEITKEINRS